MLIQNVRSVIESAQQMSIKFAKHFVDMLLAITQQMAQKAAIKLSPQAVDPHKVSATPSQTKSFRRPPPMLQELANFGDKNLVPEHLKDILENENPTPSFR